MIAYKLFRVRQDGSIGPLFINRGQRIPLHVELRAGLHPRNGYAVRRGWHACATPHAPHLSLAGRRWFKVKLSDYVVHKRPASQGERWFVAKKMKVLRAL